MRLHLLVVLPTAWITRVIVPPAGSKSAIVSGMRSPCSWDMTMTNWPGRAARAIKGCRIWRRYVTSEKSSRATISIVDIEFTLGHRNLPAPPRVIAGDSA